MKKYEMIGRPAGAFSVLTDHAVGDVFDAKLDEETEERLVNLGALRIVETPKKATDAKTKAKSKD